MPRPPARACRASGTCCSSSGPGRAAATAAAPAATRAATASWARVPRLAASSTSSTVPGATGAWRAQNPSTSAPVGRCRPGPQPVERLLQDGQEIGFPAAFRAEDQGHLAGRQGQRRRLQFVAFHTDYRIPVPDAWQRARGDGPRQRLDPERAVCAAAGGGVPAAAVISWQTPPSPPIRPWTSALPGTGSIGGSRGQLIKVSGPAPVGRCSLLASSGRNRLLASSRSPVTARTTPVAWPSRAMSCTQSSAQPSRPDRKPLSQRPHPLTSRTSGTPAAVPAGSGADARALSREETSLARRRRTRAARSMSSGPRRLPCAPHATPGPAIRHRPGPSNDAPTGCRGRCAASVRRNSRCPPPSTPRTARCPSRSGHQRRGSCRCREGRSNSPIVMLRPACGGGGSAARSETARSAGRAGSSRLAPGRPRPPATRAASATNCSSCSVPCPRPGRAIVRPQPLVHGPEDVSRGRERQGAGGRLDSTASPVPMRR